MNLSKERLTDIAAETRFRADILEKVLHLLHLLEALNEHPILKSKWALKGGTALNLFFLKVPRLSVDIDLNYTGAVEREDMTRERPKIEQALQNVCQREGFSITRSPSDHAGGKWRLKYHSALGLLGNLDVDLNFMYRQPLWKIHSFDSHLLGSYQAKNIPIMDIHELAAGKLSALFSRHAARDLFDVNQLLNLKALDEKKLRLAFFVYGAMSRKDWRTISLDDISFDPAELKQKLIPVLQPQSTDHGDDVDQIAHQLVTECRDKLSILFPFSEKEKEFLDNILERGQITPALLTQDMDLQVRIQSHPMLLWKALNVQKHYGITDQ